ncbi:MAG: glycosyltransferase family 4 protein [Gemmatimonadales bacterium]|nr:glycosyltransferase family 4 protein [Gemmatimonadales bacterium]
MRVLILSFYFEPDLSAGSFRTTSLVNALHDILPPGAEVDVVTTLPNRYQTFSVDAPARESRGQVTIHRISLPRHQSGMIDQSKAFYSFARGVSAIIAGRRFDVVYATSSRLMTAVLGAWARKRTRAKLFLDIRDIFADTMKDIFSGPASMAVGGMASLLERYAIRSATRVNLVSPGFLPYFSGRYPRQRFTSLTNGIDDEFISAGVRQRRPSPRSGGAGTITVVYAGNIGEGQGLHLILPQLGRILGDGVRFRVIGDGGRKPELAKAIAAAGLSNFELLNPMNRESLLREYLDADVLFLHLNRFDAFQKVLPSKIFEYAALGKPVWAGVSGFAAAFLQSEVSNCAVFPPCDAAAGAEALNALQPEDAPRDEFVRKFARTGISAHLARDIIELGMQDTKD